MSAFVYPALDPDSWTGITVGRDRAPGFIEFPKFRITRKIDEKDSPGSASWALTDKGPVCTEPEITFVITRAEDFPAFAAFYVDHLDPRRKLAKANVETVAHPSLYLAGIRQGYFYEASGIQPTKWAGISAYTVTARFKEFNSKTTIGATGTKKVKADLSSIGQAAKWSQFNLASRELKIPDTLAADAQPFVMGVEISKPKEPPKVRTVQQWRKDAAAGDPTASAVVKQLDLKAKGAGA